MRTVDERTAAVQRRSKLLRRRQLDRVLVVLACVLVVPLVDLAGRYATGSSTVPPAADGGLYGAASFFGSSAGGYVLAAVIAAAVAVAGTVLLMRRRGTRNRNVEDGRSGRDGLDGGQGGISDDS